MHFESRVDQNHAFRRRSLVLDGMERKGRMSIQWRWPRREKLNGYPGANLECADCRASKRMFRLRNFCLCFDFGDEILEHFGLLLFFTKPHRKNSCDPECAGGSYETHWDSGGMFRLGDFCLWVFRFKLFRGGSTHNTCPRHLWKKCFFSGWGGILSVQEALARHIGIPWGCFG